MLSKKLALYTVLLLICGSKLSVSAPLFVKKHSNLPLLLGQPEFSERLIAHNPWHSKKLYALSDSVLMHLTTVIKIPTVAVDTGSWQTNFEKSVWKNIDHMSNCFSSSGNITPAWNAGIYFNKSSALYISGLAQPSSYALVLGNDQHCFGTHVSIGQFPIHFGSGLSEYPLMRPFETALGAAVNRRALSVNKYHVWNPEHKTKLRIFGFLNEKLLRNTQDERGEKSSNKPYARVTGKYAGFSLQHEWKPAFGGVTIGVSGVNCLPLDSGKKYGLQHEEIAVDLYAHIDVGPFKFKTEILDGGVCVRPLRASLGLTDPIEQHKKEEKPLSHAWHAELAYKFPTQREMTVVTGYTKIHREPKSKFDKRLVFAGFKTKLMDNTSVIIGLQRKASQSKENYEATRDLAWKNTVYAQLNLTI